MSLFTECRQKPIYLFFTYFERSFMGKDDFFRVWTGDDPCGAGALACTVLKRPPLRVAV
jgi:hypothetical protein